MAVVELVPTGIAVPVGVTCGERVDIPQGGSCKVTFKVKNTGTLDVTFDYLVHILDANGVIVGETSDYSGITVGSGEEQSVTTREIVIDESAAIGLGKARVTILDHRTGDVLDQEECEIVNIVTGIAAEIVSISVAKA